LEPQRSSNKNSSSSNSSNKVQKMNVSTRNLNFGPSLRIVLVPDDVVWVVKELLTLTHFMLSIAAVMYFALSFSCLLWLSCLYVRYFFLYMNWFF
jgi:hypothetical protein